MRDKIHSLLNKWGKHDLGNGHTLRKIYWNDIPIIADELHALRYEIAWDLFLEWQDERLAKMPKPISRNPAKMFIEWLASKQEEEMNEVITHICPTCYNLLDAWSCGGDNCQSCCKETSYKRLVVKDKKANDGEGIIACPYCGFEEGYSFWAIQECDLVIAVQVGMGLGDSCGLLHQRRSEKEPKNVYARQRSLEKVVVERAARILCKAGVLGDAPTLNAIDKWLEEQ